MLASTAPLGHHRHRNRGRRRAPRLPRRGPVPTHQPLHRHWEQFQRWRRRGFRGLLALVILLLALPVAAVEQESDGPTVRLEDAGTGSLLFRTAVRGLFREAPRQNTDVRFEVNGMIAQVTVRQSFRNDTDEWLEGVYVFPLPEMAAVNALRMQIGERVIVGEIQEKAQARKTYEAAKKSGRRASLVEQQRANLFTTSVANLGPGETVVVELRYLETLRYADGGFSLRFPMTLTPRYVPGEPLAAEDLNAGIDVGDTGWSRPTDQVADADRITPPQAYGLAGSTQMATLRGSIRAGFTVGSLDGGPHPLHVQRRGDQWLFELVEGRVRMNRDFVVRWQPQENAAPQAALFAEERDGAHYSLLMLMPPAAPPQRTLPREVVYVIDTSGSMSGTSIEQAREALQMALRRLRPTDRFNIIEFNSDFSRLYPNTVPATPERLQQANRFVGRLKANGGTELAKPLRAALAGSSVDGLLRQVIFITDGSIGNEEALFRIIHEGLADSRLFMVGIGSAPNTFFMEKAAQFGRGTATFIGDLDEVRPQMEALFRKIETPVITDISIDWGVDAPEAWPRQVRDLYFGEPLLVSVRSATRPQTVKVNGKLAGQEWERRVRLPVSRGENHPAVSKPGSARRARADRPLQSGNGVGTLWARRKIAALLDQQRTGGEKESLRQEIIAIARTHTLVTRYTSFVAVEKTPARSAEEGLKKRAVPNRMPHGSTMTGFPRSATPAGLQILLGVLLLLLGGLLYTWRGAPRRVESTA